MTVDLPAFDGLAAMTALAAAGVRPLAMLALLPDFAGQPLPWRARLALALALALFRAWGRQGSAPALSDLPAELLAGLAAGLALAAALAAAQLAGELVGQMLGLGFAMLPAGGGPALSGWFGLLMWAAVLGSDSHLLVIADLVAHPAGGEVASLARHGAAVFAGGLLMALPAVAVLLLAQLVVALASRSAPQFGSLGLGPPLMLLALMLALPWLHETLLARATAAVQLALWPV